MLLTSARVVVLAMIVTTALTLTGCPGHISDQHPGGEVFLDLGAIGVDPRTETSFVLRGSDVFAIAADGVTVRRVTTLAPGLERVYAIFPSSGVLLLADDDTNEHAELFDADSLAPIASMTLPIVFDPQLSPSGRYVALRERVDTGSAPVLLDAMTLALHPVPTDTSTATLTWAQTRDALIGLFVYDPIFAPHARILEWDIDAVRATGFAPDASGLWPAPSHDIALPGTDHELAFSWDWIGVSPDDRWAVFPVLQSSGSDASAARLIVLDRSDGTTRTVDDAYGPAGFAPDGSAIVSYRWDHPVTHDPDTEMSGAHLLVIDTSTLATRVLDTPHDGTPQFFVTREGHWVLATFVSEVMSADGSYRDTSASLLYDYTTGTSQVLGRAVGLGAHVSRVGSDELWILDGHGLTVLPLMSGALEDIPLAFTPRNLNILPMHDRLVMDDDDDRQSLHFFAPALRVVTSTAVLPMP